MSDSVLTALITGLSLIIAAWISRQNNNRKRR